MEFDKFADLWYNLCSIGYCIGMFPQRGGVAMKYGLADLDGERRRFTARVDMYGSVPRSKVKGDK